LCVVVLGAEAEVML